MVSGVKAYSLTTPINRSQATDAAIMTSTEVRNYRRS